MKQGCRYLVLLPGTGDASPRPTQSQQHGWRHGARAEVWPIDVCRMRARIVAQLIRYGIMIH
jgi:hypothetical protein